MLKIFRLSLENSWKSMHLFSKIKHLQVLRLHFFSALVRTYPHNWSFPGNVFHIKELLNTLMGSLFSPSPRIDHSIGLPPLYLCRIFILFLIVFPAASFLCHLFLHFLCLRHWNGHSLKYIFCISLKYIRIHNV